MPGPGLVKRGLAGAANKMSKMRKAQYKPAHDLGGVAEKAAPRKVQIGDTKAPSPKKPEIEIKRPTVERQGVQPAKRVQIGGNSDLAARKPVNSIRQVQPERRVPLKKKSLFSDRAKQIGGRALKIGATAGAVAGAAGAGVQGADRFNEWKKKRDGVI